MKKIILAGTSVKHFTLLAILICTLSGCAGMERATDADKPIEFVLDAPDKTKDQLFSASKSWIAETFVSGKSVIDDADKDSGRIIAKGRIKRGCEPGWDCQGNSNKLIGFTLRIDTKDGKLRATYTNPTIFTPYQSGHMLGLTYVAGTPESETPIWMRGDLEAAKKGFKSQSEELLRYVINESVGAKNW